MDFEFDAQIFIRIFARNMIFEFKFNDFEFDA